MGVVLPDDPVSELCHVCGYYHTGFKHITRRSSVPGPNDPPFEDEGSGWWRQWEMFTVTIGYETITYGCWVRYFLGAPPLNPPVSPVIPLGDFVPQETPVIPIEPVIPKPGQFVPEAPPEPARRPPWQPGDWLPSGWGGSRVGTVPAATIAAFRACMLAGQLPAENSAFQITHTLFKSGTTGFWKIVDGAERNDSAPFSTNGSTEMLGEFSGDLGEWSVAAEQSQPHGERIQVEISGSITTPSDLAGMAYGTSDGVVTKNNKYVLWYNVSARQWWITEAADAGNQSAANYFYSLEAGVTGDYGAAGSWDGSPTIDVLCGESTDRHVYVGKTWLGAVGDGTHPVADLLYWYDGECNGNASYADYDKNYALWFYVSGVWMLTAYADKGVYSANYFQTEPTWSAMMAGGTFKGAVWVSRESRSTLIGKDPKPSCDDWLAVAGLSDALPRKLTGTSASTTDTLLSINNNDAVSRHVVVTADSNPSPNTCLGDIVWTCRDTTGKDIYSRTVGATTWSLEWDDGNSRWQLVGPGGVKFVRADSDIEGVYTGTSGATGSVSVAVVAGNANRIMLTAGCTYFVKATVVGKSVNTANDSGAWVLKGLLVWCEDEGVFNFPVVYQDAYNNFTSTPTVALLNDDLGLTVSVCTRDADTVSWVAKVELTRVGD
jgi:hypothetical protein